MMSFKEFKASVNTSIVAGPQHQQPTTSTSKHLTTDIAKESTTMSSPTPSTSSTTSSNQEPTTMKMGKLFGFIDDTYRDMRRIHSGLHKDVYNTQLMQTINKYKNGCNKIFEEVLESHDMSKKLAQNIVRTIDIFKELCTSLTDLEEYQHRVCELMAIFIACELRLSVDSTIQDQLLIGQRIVFVMRRHLVQEVEEETRYNILKTLVYLPRLFNARDIMCAIFGQFIPMKPVSDVNVLPDKLYMLYIIVFYRWMMMQKDDDDKLLIVNFAESFMKPSVTLCTNQLYATHLPRYTTHSTATRTILNNMKFYRDIRNASIIDNAFKKLGSIVDLCDDDEEDADLIILDSPQSTEFAEIFSAVQLETLGNSMSNIKLEEKTVVGTVDLTEEKEESTNPPNTIHDRHEKWLNNFQQLAKQFRESQLIMERQQNSQLISNNQIEAIICLDSDSENEDEELTAVSANASKSQEITKNTEKSSELTEDLFVDNYPPTVTPINCSTDLESSDVEDDDDATKLSSRFLSGTIRTYQAKRMHQIESQANTETAYRRDSIHISSTPPDRLDDEYSDNQDDEGTDVQDEHDQEEDEAETFPAITLQKPRPRGPYPTYNSMQNNKIVFSQSITRLPYDKEQHNQQTQPSEIKSPKKQKKKVHFNTSPVGPTLVQNKPLKPALQQSKYKASDAPDYFHLRGFERLTTSAPSTTGSTSTCGSASTTLSLNKQQEQQEHLAAAPTLFRNILGCSYSAPFSPSSSSVSSRSVTSPATPVTPTKTRKKSKVPKTQKTSIKKRRPTVGALEDMKKNDGELNSEGEYSIIRSRESLKDVHNSSGQVERTSFSAKDDSRFRESSDDYYGATSDTDIIKNDAKLRNRCTVVIKPTKELLQYERKRDELYNEILQKQRRKLELRALEKQREKERRRLSRREEKGDSDILSEGAEKGLPTLTDKRDARRRSPRNYSDICMSSESEIETNFQVRTRKQKQQQVKEIQPLASLLNEIDTYLDKPAKEVHDQKIDEPNQYVQDKNNDVHAVAGVNISENEKQQLCDINNDTGQTKMRELNLLADIAQHLSPYQLDLPECNKPPQSASSSPPPPPSPTSPINTLVNSTENKDAESKGKAIVTEQLIIQSFDNLLEKSQQIDKNEKLQPQQQQSQQNSKENLQQEDIHDYAHEPKLNVAAIQINSSPASLLKDQYQQENNTPVKDADVNPSNNNTNNTSLEQILEESIKSVTSPFNPNTECNASKTTQPQPQNESKIPLLISNVESLNHLQHNSLTGDVTSKSDGGDSDDAKNSKQNLNERKSNKFNSENVFFMNKSTNETKDVTEENTSDNTTSRLISTVVESSIICGDLSNMSSGMEMTNNTRVSTLMPADLSDISLESELSKHLPEIAEPSPVVTDMSDNSNESDVSKSFVINSTHRSTSGALESNDIPVMSLPDLPLVMPPIPPPPPLPPSQQTSISMSSSTTPHLENDYNPLDTTLNTPIKQPSLPTGGDLVTPLKFALQTDLESENSPLKSTLEPENDSNVTKFLDLILNKTVTDAESEARDKIIKELNALTADTSATESVENTQKDDIEAGSNATEDDVDADKNKNKVQNHVEEIKSLDADIDKLSKDEKVNLKSKSKKFSMKDDLQNSFEENFETNHKQFDKPSHGDESVKKDTETSVERVERNEKQEQAHKKDILIPESPEIFPPKVNSLKESTTTSINTELISTTTPNSETSNAKLKISPVKQTFNIKCRVRLKRLNITEHCKSNKKETWMAIPITKPEEPETASNDPTNCDNSKNDATTLLKKPCLKYNSNRVEDVLERKFSENFVEVTEPTATKKPKLEVVEEKPLEAIQTQTPSQQETTNLLTANTSNHGVAFSNNVSLSTKSKSKNSKTVTFDLSNLNDELKDTTCSHKQKSKGGHTSSPTAGGLGYYHKNTRHPRKLPDNTLRAAETLQIFVNTINDCARTPPPAEFNRKRSPIKNKCIAEDETPRPPLASTLLDTQSCKKVCPEKSRTQITSSKLKDQLVSSLATPSISNITSDIITTARIYTSSPLDQTLPEYDVDNVDTVADSELILPTTTGSLRRKLKRPKKSLARPEPVDDTSTDDISNQPECNGDDDTDAVVDNEDDVFAEELLPIPAANEHILEEIVSGRPTHIGTGTVIRDDYMNIEATATVPVYLFNDESRDLATPEPIQSSDANVVDSSSYLNTPSTANAATNASATTTSTIGNLEKSMLSPSEHEVSSTQETFYQTPTKSKQIDAFGDKSMANKDKSSGSLNAINNQMKNDDKTFQNKEDHPTSYSSGLLQNNQVDTTNHSPEMCSLTLGSTTTTTTTMTSNRKMRKASTHDEILFNELQQQQQQQQQQQVHLQQQQQQHQQSQQKLLQQNKRKTTMFCAQSTSDNGNIVKNKLVMSNLDDLKTNGSLGRIEDKFKKLLKDGSRDNRDKSELCNDGSNGLGAGNTSTVGGGGGGGSSPSTTTTIIEEKPSKSKRKKLKSSKSEKNKHNERSTKIVLKASKLAAHVPDNPLKITIPKSRLIRPPPTPTPPTPNEDLHDRETNSFYNNNIDKDKPFAVHNHCTTKIETADSEVNCSGKARLLSGVIDTKNIVVDSEKGKVVVLNAITSIVTNDKEKITNNTLSTKRKNKTTHNTDNLSASLTITPTTTNNNSNSTSTTITTNYLNKTNNNNSNNSIFVRDKYDLIKSKEKHHHHLQENKEKSKDKDKLNSEVKKHDNHNKSSSSTSATTNRHHNKTTSSAKEKNRKKDKEKHKSMDKTFAAQHNILKSITQKTTSSNLNTMTTLTLSPSTIVATSSDSKQNNSNNSSSKSSKTKLQDIANGSTSSATTTQVLKSKMNLSTSQTSLSSSSAAAAGLTTQISTSSTASMSPSSVTISTNHVRKKLKTK